MIPSSWRSVASVITSRPMSGSASVASMILRSILRCRIVRSESGSRVLRVWNRFSVFGVNGELCAGRNPEREDVGVRGVRGDAGNGLRDEADAVNMEDEGEGAERFASGSSSMSLVAGRRVGVLNAVVLGPAVGGGVAGLT